MEEIKLRCCPFCGETDIHIDTYEGEDEDMYEINTVTCPECEIIFMIPGEKNEVISLWNSRMELINFMKYYKNNVPIGTQKSSEEIINDYLERVGKKFESENGKLPIPHVSGSTDNEDEVYYTECPNCGRTYDEIDADFCICSKCGWDADEHCFDFEAKRNPTDLDYLNGDADILTGEWM